MYLEQFAGKGYADIVLLVRGADRYTKSIPIIIELKVGTGSGTNSYDALKQVGKYAKGFQPNNMRILSLSDHVLCVGMNLDSPNDSFINMQVVDRDQEVVPVIQSITDTINKICDSNQNVIKELRVYKGLEVYTDERIKEIEDKWNNFEKSQHTLSSNILLKININEISRIFKNYSNSSGISDRSSALVEYPTESVYHDTVTLGKSTGDEMNYM